MNKQSTKFTPPKNFRPTKSKGIEAIYSKYSKALKEEAYFTKIKEIRAA